MFLKPLTNFSNYNQKHACSYRSNRHIKNVDANHKREREIDNDEQNNENEPSMPE